MHQHQSAQLDEWLHQACACGVPELQRFALGVLKETDALRAAFTEKWSTGPVEGQITR
jgi:transposase